MTATLDRATVLGVTTPRLYTRPLVDGPPGPCGCGCALTAATSAGFAAVAFAADVLGMTLLPWQRWWLIHALELRSDGRWRFARLVTLVGRQNGKSHLLKVLALFMLFMGRARLVLGAAQSLDIAREAWQGAVDLAEQVDDLAAEVETVRYTNGEQCLTLTTGARYRITAATRGAGRGLSVDLLILDELREHRSWDAWSALSKTTTARPSPLIVGISNAGDAQSVVLNSLRETALAGTDQTLGIMEWSAPDGCALDDLAAIAQANPGVGRTVRLDEILSALATDPDTVYRTETLCQRVDALDAAVDMQAWQACADRAPSSALSQHRARLAVALDAAEDGAHVTLTGAAVLPGGRVRVEPLAAWPSTSAARAELPGLLRKLAPVVVGWFPTGPAAGLATTIRAMAVAGDRLEGELVELTGTDVAEACQEFASLIAGHLISHPDEPLLNTHLAGSSKKRGGDGWRFARRSAGHVDAAFAAAGAVRLARTLPAPPPRVRSRVF